MQGFDERRTEIIEEEHGWPSSTGQSRAGHRRGRHFGKDPRQRAVRKSIVSVWTDADAATNGGGSEKACGGLDV
jgi:hypothetical protein